MNRQGYRFGYSEGSCDDCGKKRGGFWRDFYKVSWFRGDDETVATYCNRDYKKRKKEDALK